MSFSAFFKEYQANNIEAIVPSAVYQREIEEKSYFSCLKRGKARNELESGIPQNLINILAHENKLFLIYNQCWAKYSLSKGFLLIQESSMNANENIVFSSISPSGQYLVLIIEYEDNAADLGKNKRKNELFYSFH